MRRFEKRKVKKVLLLSAFIGVILCAWIIRAKAQTMVVYIEHGKKVTNERLLTSASFTNSQLSRTADEIHSESVVTDSSKEKIEIGLTYHGEILEFFGSLGNTEADTVIVKLTSPAEKVKLNQKGKVGPLWMNVKQHEVENVPFMYKIHASQPIDSILSAQQQEELGIGFNALRKQLVIHTVKGKSAPEDEQIIFEGLLKIKRGQNLYKIDDNARIQIKKGTLFKHYFTFPPAAKEGDYIVETYLFKNGNLVGHSEDVIHVRKVGIGAKIAHWSRERPKVYGICAVLIALSVGLIVGTIFKGGGH